MKIEEKGKTIIFRDTENQFVDFVEKVTRQREQHLQQNIVIDLSRVQVTEDELLLLAPLAEAHIEANQSFVVVADINFSDWEEDALIVVPTLQEAHDLIEMDEIGRDLGF